jgi:hypothetical protein
MTGNRYAFAVMQLETHGALHPSAILMEKNGKTSSSKQTKHINIRYYFVTNPINKRNSPWSGALPVT